VLEQHQMLMLGACFMEHAFDLEGHAKAFGIEQSLGNPALLGHRQLTKDREPIASERRQADADGARPPVFRLDIPSAQNLVDVDLLGSERFPQNRWHPIGLAAP
jgi:hypothetical protein